MSDNLPGVEIVYPTNYDPYYTLFDVMKAINKPEIVGIVDDPRLSEEANLFAKVLFANIAATLEHVEQFGVDEVDDAKMPYPDSGPYLGDFYDAHPDDCVDYDSDV